MGHDLALIEQRWRSYQLVSGTTAHEEAILLRLTDQDRLL